jgi:hypothetical protein
LSIPSIAALSLHGAWLKAAAGVTPLVLGIALTGCDSHRVIDAETIDRDFSDVMPVGGEADAPCLQASDGLAQADCAATGVRPRH